jgi:hypothetical protein
LWAEYGLDEAERAVYEAGGKRITATAYRMKDSTGAFAAFQWRSPADAQPIRNAEFGVFNASLALGASGNYLLEFEGYRPSAHEIDFWAERLPKHRGQSLPALPRFTPQDGLIPNQNRYVMGEASRAAFLPELPAQALGFNFSTEAQVARYRTADGEVRLAIVGFANHAIARQQLKLIEQTPGVRVARSGPLVSVLFGGNHGAASGKLLMAVKYDQLYQYSETAPTKPFEKQFADMILTIFSLIGVLLVVCVGGGLAIAFALRTYRLRTGQAEEPMTTLRL